MLSDQKGAALYEYALTMFVFFGMIFLIWHLAWWWWTQMVVATAVHDGVRTAGARYGGLGQGYGVAYERMHWSLGQANADEIGSGMAVWSDSAHRSVQGRVQAAQPHLVPFVGSAGFEIRVGSFQRKWQFYGGQPTGWE